MKSAIKLCVIIFLVLWSCNNEELFENEVVLDAVDAAAKGQPDKITICHYEAVADTWKQMSVHPNALDNHLAHGDTVGESCPDYRLDDDNDGITNDLELCPDTPDGEPVDADGCAESQKDDDGDGVMNDMDLCPNTPGGATPNAYGCAINTSTHTFILDANFEQALIDLIIDTDGIINHRVLTTDISDVTDLSVNNNNISDLTGIEDFILLETLRCNENQLSSLNVTNNTELTYLNCQVNELTSLDVTQNIKLITLHADVNQLENIDLSKNGLLSILGLASNKLTSLDVSVNSQLTDLRVFYNELSELDLFLNQSLTSVDCRANQLVKLNIRNGFNHLILETGFHADLNPNLFCIQVDQAVYSNANWSLGIDAFTSFSEDCEY